MATITTSLIVMRWELLSAVLMFFASTLKIRLRQRSHHVMAFMCGGIGLGMTCWFVTGLLGISLSAETLHSFMLVTKDTFMQIMSQVPPDWPMP